MTEAVKKKDQETATNDKARIEDRQREEAAKRNSDGVDWHPQLFRRVQGGPGASEEGEEDLDWIINAKVYVRPARTSRTVLTMMQRWQDPRRANQTDPRDCSDSAWPGTSPKIQHSCTLPDQYQ